MSKFDDALENFAQACRNAAMWKAFYGAVYRTRLDAAFKCVKDAYENACRVYDEELGRKAMTTKPTRADALEMADHHEFMGNLQTAAMLRDLAPPEQPDRRLFCSSCDVPDRCRLYGCAGENAAEAEPPLQRIAIICDGYCWHIRSIAVIEHDMDRDEMVYRCDKPISSDHETLAKAVEALAAPTAKPDAVREAERKPLTLGHKAARYVIRSLLNQAERCEHLANIAIKDDVVADYGMIAAYYRALAKGLANDLEALAAARGTGGGN